MCGGAPIGATAWSNIAGCEYDELIEDELTQYGRATGGRAKSTRRHEDLSPEETAKDKATREANEAWAATYKETPRMSACCPTNLRETGTSGSRIKRGFRSTLLVRRCGRICFNVSAEEFAASYRFRKSAASVSIAR